MSMVSLELKDDTIIRESKLKRFFDILLALFGLIFFAPFIFFFALAIVIEEWGPVFYTQERVGKDGVTFRFYKFRTMRRDADNMPPPDDPKEGDYRITKVGNFLRATAMNELPQLINILKGDMSFVGPRPDMPKYVVEKSDQYPRYHLRHKIRPGLTGPAQFFCGYHTPEHQKLRFDLLYVAKGNLCLDITLIFRSVLRTLRAKWEH